MFVWISIHNLQGAMSVLLLTHFRSAQRNMVRVIVWLQLPLVSWNLFPLAVVVETPASDVADVDLLLVLVLHRQLLL